MPNGPQKITGIAFDPKLCQSDPSITEEKVKQLLNTSAKTKTPAAVADGAKVCVSQLNGNSSL